MDKTCIILVFLAFTAFGNGAASSDNRTGPVITQPDLTVNGTDVVNLTLPARYHIDPIQVRVEVTVADTVIPGPKGEMQAGPRSIGFTLSPALLVIIALAVVLFTAGSWLIMKRKSADEDAEQTGEDGSERE